jgi:uncharacterized protein (DUF427 family)
MDQIANPAPGFQRIPGKIIIVEPCRGTVTVRAGETVIASSTKAKLLSEPPYPTVLYIPFAFDEMTEIRNHGAFYPNKVTIEATPD